MALALAGCRSEPFREREELADAIAERAGAAAIEQLEERAAQGDVGHQPGFDDELTAALDDIEPPPTVAEMRVAPVSAALRTEDLVSVARSVVVVPDEGDPFCAVIGLSSDGTTAGSRALGSVEQDCRDAVIPLQDEPAEEGNPLDLWDQSDQPI